MPLKVDELNNYGKGIINRYKGQEAFIDYSTQNVGLMAYYNNDDCNTTSNWNYTGCTNDYEKSDVKKVVDIWAKSVFAKGALKEVNGYSARLKTYDELTKDLHYDYNNTVASFNPISAPKEYQWIYGQYTYWTMSSYNDNNTSVWYISHDHLIQGYVSSGEIGAVRPVVNIYKTAIKKS